MMLNALFWKSLNFADVELPVTCIILIGLFALQHYGTHRVGFLFAPIVTLWLFCISAIGLYNIFRWDPHIYRALSPYYMYQFVGKTHQVGWASLGGVLLCMTGKYSLNALSPLTFDPLHFILNLLSFNPWFPKPHTYSQVQKLCLLIWDTSHSCQ